MGYGMLRRILLGVAILMSLSSLAEARPRAWCGWFMSEHLGLHRRDLWLARNWAHVGAPAGGPVVGAIVVWPHHVGKITAIDSRGVRVLSGNDGHRVRDRYRSIKGAIAFRVLHGADNMPMRTARSRPAKQRTARHEAALRQEPRSMSALLEGAGGP